MFFHRAKKPARCPVYQRAALGAANRIAGPALIQEFGTTTVLFEQDACTVAQQPLTRSLNFRPIANAHFQAPVICARDILDFATRSHIDLTDEVMMLCWPSTDTARLLERSKVKRGERSAHK